MEHAEHGPLPELTDLTDEDFIKFYPENGFGWDAVPNLHNDPETAKYNERAAAIANRYQKLHQERPDLFGKS